MRYGQIRNYDVANGVGVRVSVFVTGCHFNCYNCFNKEYQDFNYGTEWTDETTEFLLEKLSDDNIDGLSILGGEPMEFSDTLVNIVKEVDKPIWLWSGYLYEDIIKDSKKLNLLKHVDILVDGLYVEKKKDLSLRFRGSSNQRIINVKESLETGEVILACE